MALGSPKTRSPRSIPAAAELLLGATGHRSLLLWGATSSPQPLALPCARGRHPPEGCSQLSVPLANREVRGEHLFPGRKVLDRGTPEHPLLAKTPAPDLVICSAWCFAPRAMARGCSAPRISPPVPIRSGYGGPGCAHGVRSASALWKEPSTRAAFLCSPPSGFAWQWGDREATCPVLCVSLFLQASLPNSLLIPARAAPLSAALRCSPSMQGRKCQQGNDSAIVQRLKYGNPV